VSLRADPHTWISINRVVISGSDQHKASARADGRIETPLERRNRLAALSLQQTAVVELDLAAMLRVINAGRVPEVLLLKLRLAD
jgi:hypothetical protein